MIVVQDRSDFPGRVEARLQLDYKHFGMRQYKHQFKSILV